MSKHTKWIPLTEAIENYGIKEMDLYVVKNKYGDDIKWLTKIRGRLYVNIGYLLAIKEFHKKVWLECHIFYYLLDTQFSDIKKAELIAIANENSEDSARVINQIFSTMFSTRIAEKPLHQTRINQTIWIFWRICRWLFIKLLKIKRLKYDIKKLEEFLYEKSSNS